MAEGEDRSGPVAIRVRRAAPRYTLGKAAAWFARETGTIPSTGSGSCGRTRPSTRSRRAVASCRSPRAAATPGGSGRLRQRRAGGARTGQSPRPGSSRVSSSVRSATAGSPLGPGSSRLPARLARASEPAAQTALAVASTRPDARTSPPTVSPPRAAPTTKIPDGRRPLTAPHPAKRESDVRSNPRRPSMTTRIPETMIPETKPSGANRRAKGRSDRSRTRVPAPAGCPHRTRLLPR
jgi:hypothetical protein